MRWMAIAGLLATGGCMTTPEPPATEGRCRTEGLTDYVGRAGTQELASEAQRRSGARSVRWKAPGMAVTMDYRPDRLNISIDAGGMVTGFDCG